MYSVFIIVLAIITQLGQSLVFRLPTLNTSIYPGASSIIVWGEFGDVTEVSVYLAHGTPSNYTILQTIGENIPSSTDSVVYHLPQTLPPTDVFFMLVGNDSPKTVVPLTLYVDPSRGLGFGSFPSISIPSDFPFPSGFSLPSGFPFTNSVPTSNPTTHPAPGNHTDPTGLPMPAIIGIALGSFFFFVTVILTAVIMRRRTMIRKRRALLRYQQQQNGTPKPPPKWSEKPTDINVNVAIQGIPENQQQQATEYNYNYQPQYNYSHQQEYAYDYEQQADVNYTNQQPAYSSPGGFIVPAPKTAAPLHDITSSPTATVVPSPPAPTYQKLASTKTSVTDPAYENKPNLTNVYHKPNENHPSDKPHSNPTIQKPHSHSPS